MIIKLSKDPSRYYNNYMAEIEGTNIKEHGTFPSEAIGTLIMMHRELFDISFTTDFKEDRNEN